MQLTSTNTCIEGLQNLVERGPALRDRSTSELKGTLIPIPLRLGVGMANPALK